MNANGGGLETRPGTALVQTDLDLSLLIFVVVVVVVVVDPFLSFLSLAVQ